MSDLSFETVFAALKEKGHEVTAKYGSWEAIFKNERGHEFILRRKGWESWQLVWRNQSPHYYGSHDNHVTIRPKTLESFFKAFNTKFLPLEEPFFAAVARDKARHDKTEEVRQTALARVADLSGLSFSGPFNNEIPFGRLNANYDGTVTLDLNVTPEVAAQILEVLRENAEVQRGE